MQSCMRLTGTLTPGLYPCPIFLHNQLLKTDPHESGNHLEIPERNGLWTRVITGIVFINDDMIGDY